MSRFCGAWVALIAVADTMDSGAVINVNIDRIDIKKPDASTLPPSGVSIRRNDDPMAKEARLRQFKIPAAQEFVRVNGLDKVTLEAKKRKFGIIASGQAYNLSLIHI